MHILHTCAYDLAGRKGPTSAQDVLLQNCLTYTENLAADPAPHHAAQLWLATTLEDVPRYEAQSHW